MIKIASQIGAATRVNSIVSIVLKVSKRFDKVKRLKYAYIYQNISMRRMTQLRTKCSSLINT